MAAQATMTKKREMSEDDTTILGRVESPADIKSLSFAELEKLAAEIRREIVAITAANGGHVASNLGVVELTLALHKVFDSPRDKLLWDTSHQCYAHKLITGRRDFMKTLRRDDGCVGFASREESPHDAFGAGHAGTAISAALGMAVARDRQGGVNHVVAVVGDASLNCGISLEGLNNVRDNVRRFVIVLNDNKMSISRNVGGIAAYLNSIIPSPGYNKTKAFLKKLVLKIPGIGDQITKSIAKIEEATKSMLVPGVLFEDLGIRYVGPVDGHDLKGLVWTLEQIKEFDCPVLLHVITEKGRGYDHAEDSPEKFHGLPGYDPETGQTLKRNGGPSYSEVFGRAVVELGEKHSEVVAITAGMRSGTGLKDFAGRFPGRFFDVGIAEEHALVFAAGLAAEGLRPVVALYATFLQRALDCVQHDICLQNLPVIICADRAGIVDDGPTHHGIYDLSFLRTLPNLAIMAPYTDKELRAMLLNAHAQKCPALIRYPRGEAANGKGTPAALEWGKSETLRLGKDLAIWGMGAECGTALEVAALLAQSGREATVVNTRFLKPFDGAKLLSLAGAVPLATIEDNQIQGGLAATVDELLVNEPHHGVWHFGWGDAIVPHGSADGIRRKHGMSATQIAETLLRRLENNAR